jgi:hypothetical protein
VARALAAAAVLAVVGALLGGAIGWLAFLFFSVASVALIVQLVGRRPVVEVDERGVTVAAGPDQAQLVAWDDVEAILLWTRGARGPDRVDMFSVVTSGDLPGLATSLAEDPPVGDDPAPGAAPGGRVDPERVLRVAAPLRDCRVDAYELRAALLRFSKRVAVVDRRA